MGVLLSRGPVHFSICSQICALSLSVCLSLSILPASSNLTLLLYCSSLTYWFTNAAGFFEVFFFFAPFIAYWTVIGNLEWSDFLWPSNNLYIFFSFQPSLTQRHIPAQTHALTVINRRPLNSVAALTILRALSEKPDTLGLTAMLEALVGNSVYCVVCLCYRPSAAEGETLSDVWINISIPSGLVWFDPFSGNALMSITCW